MSLPRPPTPCLSFSFFLYYLLCSLLYFQPLKFTGLVRKENYSCGETTEVCPKTTLGYLDLVYSVASKQQLNCRNLREKKKKKQQKSSKALKKALVICLLSRLRALQFAPPLHPCDKTRSIYISPLLTEEQDQKTLRAPIYNELSTVI